MLEKLVAPVVNFNGGRIANAALAALEKNRKRWNLSEKNKRPWQQM